MTLLPLCFGQFGWQYVLEALFDGFIELEEAHDTMWNKPTSWAKFKSHYGYMNCPSKLPVYFAGSLTRYANGEQIWLKREDLNHTRSHKINNTIGQILLAKHLRRTRIITEMGAGQHGVATATVCACFRMKCIIYMGAEDAQRQALNVFHMKMWVLRYTTWNLN
ncbi:hypothetical protein PISMIDRAFT_658685 [Pisolithus microcarpus 441]|uniref:tryptophan synthase n=1 Tax=Pisolithus microcarpus 441 TaxID=765257 RepID=A0A0C9ZB57_9AGAM|nr:hypothetical protein PISMIDRAFT_658685 [Pisolithus microcarpus 441]